MIYCLSVFFLIGQLDFGELNSFTHKLVNLSHWSSSNIVEGVYYG